jgi:hypothetical protein
VDPDRTIHIAVCREAFVGVKPIAAIRAAIPALDPFDRAI